MTETTRERILVFNDPYQMRVNKELAMEIGLDDSMMLLQLEYLITISSHEIDGRRWTYQSYQGLHDDHFPFWSVAKIARIIQSLDGQKLILIGRFNKKGYDRTQWYALNPEGIVTLRSVAIFQNEKSISQTEKWNRANGEMEPRDLQNATARNERPIPKTSTKTSTEKESSSAPVVAADFDSSLEAYKDRPELHTLVGLLKTLIERNLDRPLRKWTPAIEKRWLDSCRLMLDRDMISTTEIERVIRWATSDPFWKKNILSFPTFREQFDRLQLGMQSAQPDSQRRTFDPSDHDYGDTVVR